MAARELPDRVDTVIVGNGPSALVLSFILHGHIPYYDIANPHPDPILHQKLQEAPCLLNIDINDLTAHFSASRISYSTQALPVNVLLDTLLRPLADTNPNQYGSCVQWRHEPGRSVKHVVLGNTANAGGQWADNPIAGSWDIGALSYAEMLSLPGYSLLKQLRTHSEKPIEEFHRPSRREVAEYLKVYPAMVGIEDSIYTNSNIDSVIRDGEGFFISSYNLRCKHLVLASGTFSNLIPARPLLHPLLDLPNPMCESDYPLLVVGSGFTAADVILSTPPNRKIVHIFKWAPDEYPSPLRACHPRAYPEYASIYRRMKLAAKKNLGPKQVFSPIRKRSNPFEGPDWEDLYEGLPNTCIKAVIMHNSTATVTLENNNHEVFKREVSSMQYVIGRRGSLEYLEENVLAEVFENSSSSVGNVISGKTLRSKAEEDLEVASNIFIVGSLTGDSLIRFAFGGCVYAAREIMRRNIHPIDGDIHDPLSASAVKSEDHHHVCMNEHTRTEKNSYEYTNGHSSLDVDMKSRAMSADSERRRSDLRKDSKWWLGGCTLS